MAHRFCLSVFLLKTRDTGSNLNKKVPIQYMYLLEWKRIAKRKYCYFCNEITHCVASWCLQVKIFPSTLVKKQGGVVSYFYSHAFMQKSNTVLGFLSFHAFVWWVSYFFFAAQLGQDSLFEVIFEFNHTLTLSREFFFAFLNVTKLKQVVN